jgi:hypothetical protein
LAYNDEWLAIINITDEPMDVSNLRFSLVTSEGEQALELSRFFGVDELAALAPGDCFQLVTAQDIANDTSALRGVCRRQAWAAPGRNFLFWVSDLPDALQFNVSLSRGGRERQLTTCDVIQGIDERTCEFTTVLQRGASSAPDQAETPLAQASSPAPTEEAAEPTEASTDVPPSPTDEPTEAPTEAASATPRPATATARPASATPTQASSSPTQAADATLKLVYDDNRVYLINISTRPQNISRLRFEQEANGRAVAFRANIWTETSVAQLPPGGCYQLGVSAGAASTTPDECNSSFGWLQRNESNQFWRSLAGSGDTFTVFQDDQSIAECNLSAGECAFSLP